MISTIEQFKNQSVKEVQLPGGFTVLCKPVSLLGLISKGNVPNALMSQVSAMFGQNTKDPNQEVDVMQNAKDMTSLIECMCEECLVEPKYSDIKDYLTDEQKTAIFNFSQGGINEVAPSVEDKKIAINSTNE